MKSRSRVLLLFIMIFILVGCSQKVENMQTSRESIAATNAGVKVEAFCDENNKKEGSADEQLWKDAYMKFLEDIIKKSHSKKEFGYVIRNIDEEPTPELLIEKEVCITVYRYNGKVEKVGSQDFVTGTLRLLVSDNACFPGIFTFTVGGGRENHGYLTIRDNVLGHEELWNWDYSGISKELGLERQEVEELSSNKELINESKLVYKQNSELEFKKLTTQNLKLDSLKQLSDEDIKSIMQEIDSQVKKINDKINHELYQNHYDKDILIFRYFNCDVEQESFAEYYLYYNEQGKLIYADISHYREAHYSIYFHNDELLHVEVGPFLKDGLFINGDMANVKEVIKKEPSYEFVLEDYFLCLEHAYK